MWRISWTECFSVFRFLRFLKERETLRLKLAHSISEVFSSALGGGAEPIPSLSLAGARLARRTAAAAAAADESRGVMTVRSALNSRSRPLSEGRGVARRARRAGGRALRPKTRGLSCDHSLSLFFVIAVKKIYHCINQLMSDLTALMLISYFASPPPQGCSA